MSGIYRASITTAGFTASRLYELDDDDELDPRAKALIDAKLLTKQADESIGGGASLGAPRLTIDKADPGNVGPYADPDGSSNDYSRHGVPTIP